MKGCVTNDMITAGLRALPRHRMHPDEAKNLVQRVYREMVRASDETREIVEAEHAVESSKRKKAHKKG